MKNTRLRYLIETSFVYEEGENYFFDTYIDENHHVLQGEMKDGYLMYRSYNINDEEQNIDYDFNRFLSNLAHDEHLNYKEREFDSKVDYQAESDYMNKQYESDKI